MEAQPIRCILRTSRVPRNVCGLRDHQTNSRRTRQSGFSNVAFFVALIAITFLQVFSPATSGIDSRVAAQSLRPFAAAPPTRDVQRGIPRAIAARPIQIASENFIVSAEDARLAKQVSLEAERFRKELAIEWLGHEIGPWQDKCPITVELGMHAGGETSFAFVTNGRGQGIPVSWQMKIYGPPDRLLDAVLPHEITHTIFATHFGRPLPRWADEGACTTVEHESERRKNHQMLMDFLGAKPSRGIPFNRMFTMKNYPHDILPLYAQGYSLAKFLIAQKGRRHFLDFVEAGMNAEVPGRELAAWDSATEKFYGFENLSELQISWLGWVKDGSDVAAIASVVEAPSPASNRSPISAFTMNVAAGDSWYAREANSSQSRVAANRTSNFEEAEKLSPPARFRADTTMNIPDTIWR